jgi:hypothetical protein
MKIEKLRKITDEIIDSDIGDGEARKDVFKVKYPNFADKYPTLFGTCCASISGSERCKCKQYVEFLLGMLAKTQSETDCISTHDASVSVGQRLYDDFVAPVVRS